MNETQYVIWGDFPATIDGMTPDGKYMITSKGRSHIVTRRVIAPLTSRDVDDIVGGIGENQTALLQRVAGDNGRIWAKSRGDWTALKALARYGLVEYQEESEYLITALGYIVTSEIERRTQGLDELPCVQFNREKTAMVTGLEHRVIHHSPTGFEWGYLGAGCADLSLNLLHTYFACRRYQGTVIPMHRGETWGDVATLYQTYKERYVAVIPREVKNYVHQWEDTTKFLVDNAPLNVLRGLGLWEEADKKALPF